MEDKKLTLTILFDFFGELLTAKQREYFDLYYNEDMSLSEIAENTGISRQGVRDMLVRSEAALLEYEEKTGVVARYCALQRRVSELVTQANALASLASREEDKAAAEELAAGLKELALLN